MLLPGIEGAAAQRQDTFHTASIKANQQPADSLLDYCMLALGARQHGNDTSSLFHAAAV